MHSPAAIDPRLLTTLAATAHACWCARRRREGWRTAPPGKSDPAAKRHDGLRPFRQLPPEDREYLRILVQADELFERLADRVDLPRGTDRPLSRKDLRKGLRVYVAHGSDEAEHQSPSDIGSIEGWEIEPRACYPRWITVRWDDGEVTRHTPFACELRLLERGQAE